MINKDGYRYLQDYQLGTPEPKPVLRSMELGPRDRLSQAFVKELEKGRTVDTPYGPVVHLDLRHLGERVIDAKIPFVRELCRKYQNLDPVKDLIPVRPVIHYMMGGVHTDINGATPLPGLYAAGEVACVSINGANRLGSNSLPELLVFGARAGRAAADTPRVERTCLPVFLRRRPTSDDASSRRSSTNVEAASALPTSDSRCRRRLKNARASTARGVRWLQDSAGWHACRSAPSISCWKITVALSTPNGSPHWS